MTTEILKNRKAWKALLVEKKRILENRIKEVQSLKMDIEVLERALLATSGTMAQHCICCKVTLPATSFSPCQTNRSGLRSVCKKCASARARASYHRRKELRQQGA